MGPVDQRRGDERRLRRSSFLAGVGDGMVATALALLAAGLTRDPLSVAAVFAAQHLPWAAVAVIGHSAWLDADRRTVLGLGVTLRAVAVTVVGLLALAGAETVVALVLAALAFGLGEALADQAEHVAERGGSPTELVATGRSHALFGLAVVGLPAGGLVYEVAAALPFLLDIGVFAVAALAALTLRAPLSGRGLTGTPSTSARRARPAAIPPLAAGTASVTVVASMSVGAASAVSGVLVLFALDDLGLGAPAFGVVLAGLAGSSLLGSLMAPTLGRLLGLRAGLAFALALSGAGYAAASVMGEPSRALVAAFALGIGAAGSTAAAVLVRALLHVGAGRAVEGGHLVAFHARVWACIPLGGLVGGVVARAAGVADLLMAAGLLLVVAAVTSVVMVAGAVPLGARSSGVAPARVGK